jgi:hypothetical protein
MTDLNRTHEEYEANIKNWQLLRDLVAGESALKQHDLKTIRRLQNQSQSSVLNDTRKIYYQYLPNPDAASCQEPDTIRYCQYVQRASLFNATKRTERGMTGMVFSKPTELNLPESIAYIEEDVDGSGTSLKQQTHQVLNDVLETGGEGLFVDYPDTDAPATIAQANEGELRAAIHVYKREQIKDWHTIRIGAKVMLGMVKLAETVTKRDPLDPTTVKTEEVTRVLLLDENLEYVVRVYRSEDDFDEFRPTDASGKTFNSIPFFFAGAVNNKPDVDPAPLIELAEVNLAHYRNSADFEESCFVVGQPMPVVSGLTEAWAEKYFKSGIGFGSRAGLLLPQGADAKIVQAEANSMPEQGMTRKEKQMIELGARLVQQGGAAETAEAARIKHAADASVLSVVVANMNDAYKQALKAVMMFQSATEAEFELSINTDFFDAKMTTQDLLNLVSAWQSGAYSKEVLDKNLVKGGFIDEDTDLEAMNEVIDNEPVLPNFDEPDEEEAEEEAEEG